MKDVSSWSGVVEELASVRAEGEIEKVLLFLVDVFSLSRLFPHPIVISGSIGLHRLVHLHQSLIPALSHILLIVPLFVHPPQVLFVPQLSKVLLYFQLLNRLVQVENLCFLVVELILQISQALYVLCCGQHIHSNPAIVLVHLEVKTTAPRPFEYLLLLH